MGPVQHTSRSTRWTVRLLAGGCAVLGVMCAVLAFAWSRKSDEAACYRTASAAGETPAIAESDCGGAN